MPQIAADNESPCQACGACCSYSQNWPRFTIEDEIDDEDFAEAVTA